MSEKVHPLSLDITKKANFPIFFVLLILVSLHLYGIGVVHVQGLHIALWDFASLVLMLCWVANTALTKIKVTHAFIIGLFLASLFNFWAGIGSFYSPEPFRGLTMFVQQIRNLLLFFLIGSLITAFPSDHIGRLNRVVFALGIVIAVIGILLFIVALRNYPAIVTTPSLWKPEPRIGYVLDQGGILRLIGLARDPNFYSLWLAPSFLAGLSLKRSWAKWVGIIIMGVSLLLAMSRTFIVVFIISSLLIAIPILLNRKLRRPLWPYLRAIGLAMLFIIIAAFIWSLATHTAPWELLKKRFELASTTPRWEYWELLSEKSLDNMLIGMGARGAETVLGGMYSHNSYLDLLVERGIIGFALWSAFTLFVTAKAVQKLWIPSLVPWIHTWILTLGMFLAFSLVYNPFFWMVAAIIVSAPYKQRGTSDGAT